MNRATSERFTSRTNKVITEGNACLQTPPPVFEKLYHDLGPFDIDLTADASNHLCPVWIGPGGVENDALTAVWMKYGKNGYSNPPYGDFVPHMLALAKRRKSFGFSTTFLLPLRANESFRENILKGATDLLFCDRRICFYEHHLPKLNMLTGKPDVAMFDSIVVTYRAGCRSKLNVDIWHVPDHF